MTPVAHYPFGRRALPRKMAGRPFQPQKGQFTEKILRVPYLRHGNSRAARLLDQCFSAALSIPAGFMVRKPDVVIVTAPGSAFAWRAGYILAKARGVPLIVEMRDAWPDLARDARLVQGSVKGVVERVVDFVQHRADLVVTVTEGFAATLRARGIRNVATVSNGVHLELHPRHGTAGTRPRRLRSFVPGEPRREPAAGRGHQGKRPRGDSMHLHMVGHGTQRPALEKLARELKAPVTFHAPLTGTPCSNAMRRPTPAWCPFATTGNPSKPPFHQDLRGSGHRPPRHSHGARRSGPDCHGRGGRGHRCQLSGSCWRICGASSQLIEAGWSATGTAVSGLRPTQNMGSSPAATWTSSPSSWRKPSPANDPALKNARLAVGVISQHLVDDPVPSVPAGVPPSARRRAPVRPGCDRRLSEELGGRSRVARIDQQRGRRRRQAPPRTAPAGTPRGSRPGVWPTLPCPPA